MEDLILFKLDTVRRGEEPDMEGEYVIIPGQSHSDLDWVFSGPKEVLDWLGKRTFDQAFAPYLFVIVDADSMTSYSIHAEWHWHPEEKAVYVTAPDAFGDPITYEEWVEYVQEIESQDEEDEDFDE